MGWTRDGDRMLMSPTARRWASAIILVASFLYVSPAQSFPPYRSTDADTSAPNTVELRLGLVEVEREDRDDKVTTPLVRLNLGLPGHAEFVTELEYVPRDERLGDAAVGVKWAPIRGAPALGVETLALLPVRADDRGLGFEGQLLATLEGESAVLHVNGGGFLDARSSPTEAGWRASALVELPLSGIRPGFEAFAKQQFGDSFDARIGVGAIVSLGRFDLRAGVHAGVTPEAPDVSLSLWLGTKFSAW